MLTNKESLDQIIVATPGLRSDPVALGETSAHCKNLVALQFPSKITVFLCRSSPRQRPVCAVHRPQHAGHVSVNSCPGTGLRSQEESDSNSHLLVFARLIGSHPALVNAIILVLHSVAGSMPSQASGSSSRNVSASSYSDMPGG